MEGTGAEGKREEGAVSLDSDMAEILKRLDVTEMRPDAEEDDEEDDEEERDGEGSLSSDDTTSTTELEASAPPDVKDKPVVSETDVDIGLNETDDSPKRQEEKSDESHPPSEHAAASKPAGSVSVMVDKDACDKAKKKKRKGPIEFLKRRLSKENHEQAAVSSRIKTMMAVQVDSLPQVFVTKFLGKRVCKGLWGIKHTRGPVDELVREVQHTPDKDLPLVQLHVSQKGIHSALHSQNKAEEKEAGDDSAPGSGFNKGLLPIEFVSYAVQDTKFTRVFCLIVVRELSWRQKSLECLAYVLDSSLSARRLALSVAMAFKQYAKTLEGKPYKFQVDLRPPHEVEKDMDKKDAECDA